MGHLRRLRWHTAVFAVVHHPLALVLAIDRAGEDCTLTEASLGDLDK